MATVAGLGFIAPATAAPPISDPAPITVTPRVLVPRSSNTAPAVDLPTTGDLSPPAGAEALAVTIGSVQIENGFPAMKRASEAVFAPVTGRTTTLAAVYAAASALEAAYARAGYILARVVIVPQDLLPGGPFRVVIVDGFIEAIDLSALPKGLRSTVSASLAPILRRHQLKLGDIEQALLLAGDAPGASLRSALAPGQEPGGTRLVIDGTFRRAGAIVGLRNDYAPQLGTYGVSAEFALNSPFGGGESLYGYVAGGHDISDFLNGNARVRVLGSGLLLRAAHGRVTFNPEITVSRTRPDPAPGAPQTIGLLNRYSLRASYALVRRRDHNAVLSLAAEANNVGNRAPDFGVDLSHDRYVALRAALSLTGSPARPASLTLTFSQGLGRFGPPPSKLAPLSREGARADFSRLEASASMTWPAPGASTLTVSARAQSSFGQALLRTEQFSLEGEGAVSAYVGGVTAVDEGAVLRTELAISHAFGPVLVAPYLAASGGAGRVAHPTSAEPASIRVGAIGAGLRAQLSKQISLSAEYGFALSDFTPLDHVQRLSVSVGITI
jgi:hemolysin activation/secretion protein